MTKVIAVKFKQDGRVYYFDPADNDIKTDSYVIVETARGTECGYVSLGNHEVPDNKIVAPLKKVIRIADSADIEKMEANRVKEKEAFGICEELIEKHGLDMCLTRVEYSFDGSKIIFFFTSDGRVDFRELVKDLAYRFHTRIELRQIGVRDEAKMLGGIGICGQPFCCSRYLKDFQPVSIKMAKEQGLSLNPTKISGSCGRLMCCLKHEQEAYEDLIKITPPLGSFVKTKFGNGTVIDANMITGNLLVKIGENESPTKVNRSEVQILSLGKKKKQAEEITEDNN
ncbi:MAG: stage 0 sporulation family protein [Clostridiales bacterium]|nr:stage 0 sporulation family protein [Candidatus Equinaster intestinalis]